MCMTLPTNVDYRHLFLNVELLFFIWHKSHSVIVYNSFHALLDPIRELFVVEAIWICVRESY